METLFKTIPSLFEEAWWVEIFATEPYCVYYFGPFENQAEAIQSEAGFVEDLKQEGAEVLQITVMKRLAPRQLTID
jgi:hypothetical protein